MKTAAGAGRVVRLRLVAGSDELFATVPGVTAVHTDGERVSPHTADADSTVWALYELRNAIATSR